MQVSAGGLQSIPLSLAVSWRCEPASTDLRIDYKYNGEAMTTPMALNNVQFLVPVDGGVSKLQAILPPAAWYSHVLIYTPGMVTIYTQICRDCFFPSHCNPTRNAEQQRILWKIPDISQKSENGGLYCTIAWTLRDICCSQEDPPLALLLYKTRHVAGLPSFGLSHFFIYFFSIAIFDGFFSSSRVVIISSQHMAPTSNMYFHKPAPSCGCNCFTQ